MFADERRQRELRTWTLNELKTELHQWAELKDKHKRGKITIDRLNILAPLYLEDELEEAIRRKTPKKRTNLEHIIVKQEVKKLLKHKGAGTLNDILWKVAGKRGKGIDAVKRNWYYKPKSKKKK